MAKRSLKRRKSSKQYLPQLWPMLKSFKSRSKVTWPLTFLASFGPFYYTAVAGSGKVWPVNKANHTSLLAVATPLDRPKSVRTAV